MPARRFETAEAYRLHKNEQDRIRYAKGLQKRPSNYNEMRRDKYASDKADKAILLYKEHTEHNKKSLKRKAESTEAEANAELPPSSSDSSMAELAKPPSCSDSSSDESSDESSDSSSSDESSDSSSVQAPPSITMTAAQLQFLIDKAKKDAKDELAGKAKVWKKRVEAELAKKNAQQHQELVEKAKVWMKHTEQQLMRSHVDKCFDSILADTSAADTSAPKPLRTAATHDHCRRRI